MSWKKFGSFIEGITAAQFLKNRAGEKGCFIEYLCLSATITDAILRTAIILTNQINNSNKEIDSKLCYQDKLKNKITEREIYRISYKMNIIDKKLFDKLNNIYDNRNESIHRYAITEIKYNDILSYCEIYDTIIKELNSILYGIEKLQIEKEIGITVLGPECTAAELFDTYAKEKINNDSIIKEIKENKYFKSKD